MKKVRRRRPTREEVTYGMYPLSKPFIKVDFWVRNENNISFIIFIYKQFHYVISHIREKSPISFVMSVRLSARIVATRTKQTYVKFYIGDFYKILAREPKSYYNRTKISGNLYEDLSKLLTSATHFART